MDRRLLLAAAFWLMACWSPALQAHSGDATGFASISVHGAELSYRYTAGPAAGVEPGALPALLREHIEVEADGQRCSLSASSGEQLDFRCAAPIRQLQVRDRLPEALGQQHHVIALLTWPGGSQSHAFSATEPLLTADLGSAAATREASGFFLLGIEHILTGYDHLLFVLALLLGGRSLAGLAKIVTAFTIAHSLTLGAAALDLVSLPSALVEAVIALSIAWVAFENLSPRYALGRRWLLSFLFGLVHGFGFSSVLKEIGLPAGSELLALLNFNLGVEAGQLAALLLALPVLRLLEKSGRQAHATRLASWLVLAIGLALFGERLLVGA